MNKIDILNKQLELLREVDFLALKHTQNERKYIDTCKKNKYRPSLKEHKKY